MHKQIITQKILKEFVEYNSSTGIFTNKIFRGSIVPGQIIGCKSTRGYIFITIDYKTYNAHHLAWLYVRGYLPKQIDHIDHDRSNNSFSNLREATSKENSRNRKVPKNSRTKIMGVTWDKTANKWRARIKVDGIKIHLGLFTNIKNAEKARKEADIKYGFHPNHGS